MRVPECPFIFLRILKMRNENFGSFSIFISVENWKQLYNPFFFIFHFLKWRFFDFFFQIFEKNETRFIFSVSQKINKIEILILSSFFNFEKKMKIEILWIYFLILFRFFLLPLLLRWRPCARQDPDQPCLQRKQASRGQRISISRSSIARRH